MRASRDRTASSTVKVRVDRLKGLNNDAGQKVNHLVWEVQPTALDDLGLKTAILQLVEAWSDRSALAFDLHLTLDRRRLSSSVESVL